MNLLETEKLTLWAAHHYVENEEVLGAADHGWECCFTYTCSVSIDLLVALMHLNTNSFLPESIFERVKMLWR